MALNPILDSNFNPLLYPSETVIFNSKETFSTVEFNNGIIFQRASGITYLTNARVIFIHNDIELSEHNYALHHNLITEEHLTFIGELLLFQGNISPYANFMPSAGKFKIELSARGSQDFKRHTENFIRQIRMVHNVPVMQNAGETRNAFVDPQDPDLMIVVE